jgi:hypothetical protein
MKILLAVAVVISMVSNVGALTALADGVASVNANPNVPKDSDYIFFEVGTEEEEKYMYGTGEDYKADFNSTHEGMGIDGNEGGYSSKLPPNARLFHGQSVTYEFDLIDSAKEAILKVYGMTGMSFEVSSDNGASWVMLTPEDAPIGNGRGYFILNLTEADALKDGSNKFLLKLAGDNGVLMCLMIQTQAPVLTQAAHFEIRSEDSLRYVESSNALRTYYADKKFANYIIDDKGYTIFKIPFHESVKDAVFYVTYSGDAYIEIAGEDGQYEMLLSSLLGPSGTPHTNVYDLSGYLENNSVLYFRLSGSAAGGFLDSMGIAVTPVDELEGGFGVFAGGEAKYLYDMAKNDKFIGLTKRLTVGNDKARGVDSGKDVTYRLDLADTVDGVDLFVDAVGPYIVTVSIDGKEFVAPAEIEDGGLRVLELLQESEDKVLYVKIINVSDTAILELHGMTFTTKNIVIVERPTTPDFGYDEEPTDPPAQGTEPNPTEPIEPAPGNDDSMGLWIAVGVVVVVAVLAILYLKKKKSQK